MSVCDYAIKALIAAAALYPVAMVAALLSYDTPCLAGPCFTHRYRLTLDVEVDGQLRSGSSVVEVTWAELPGKLGPVWGALLSGEATLVDLGPHGVLLATLSGLGTPERHGVNAAYLALTAHAVTVPNIQLPFGPYGQPDERSLAMLRRMVNRRVDLGPGGRSQLVWLADPRDCGTAQVVATEGLPQAIAPSIRFRGMTLEITRGRITSTLAEHLPWLTQLVENDRPGQRPTERLCWPHAPDDLAAVELRGHALSQRW